MAHLRRTGTLLTCLTAALMVVPASRGQSMDHSRHRGTAIGPIRLANHDRNAELPRIPRHGGGVIGGPWPVGRIDRPEILIAPPIVPPQPPGAGHGCHTGGIGVSPALALTDDLIARVGAFIRVFGPTRDVVPTGEFMFADAVSLHRSAIAFRQAIAAGAPPAQVAALYQQMDGACCRLVTKVDRVALGRTGPNINQVHQIAALCHQIRAYL